MFILYLKIISIMAIHKKKEKSKSFLFYCTQYAIDKKQSFLNS